MKALSNDNLLNKEFDLVVVKATKQKYDKNLELNFLLFAFLDFLFRSNFFRMFQIEALQGMKAGF